MKTGVTDKKERGLMRNKVVRRSLALAVAAMTLACSACGSAGTAEESSTAKTEAAEEDSTAAETAESGSTENSASSDGLTMSWWGNQVRNERTQQVLDLYAEESGTSVRGQFFQWGDYWSKLATDAAGGTMSDVVQMDYEKISSYIQNDLLLDLTPYIESGAIDVSNIDESVLNLGKIDGKIYGIPAGVSSPCLFYNKTLTDSLNIEIKDNMTLDEFKELSKQIYEESGYHTNLISTGNYMSLWNRGEGLNLTSTELPGTAEDYAAYFQILEDGVKEGWHIDIDIADSSTGTEDDPLIYGSSPATMSWCTVDNASLLLAFQSAAPEGVEIGVTTIPTDDPKVSNYLKPSMFFTVSTDCTDPDSAVALVNYLINSEEANKILLAERGIPASQKVSAAIYDLLDESSQTATDFVNNVITPNCSQIDPPSPNGYSELMDLLIRLEEQVGYGASTAQEAGEAYYTQGNEILKNNNQ